MAFRGQQDRKTVAIFEPDLTETTTLARAAQFVEGGYSPVIFGFRRGRYNRRHISAWPEIELGRTEDARYWERLKALVHAIPSIIRNRQCLASSFAFFARNLDQLLLALFAKSLFNRCAIVAYEVVDIQPAFTRKGFRGAMIRWLEKRCLERIGLLIVSSPAFYRDYFSKIQAYRGEWLLVENKFRPPASCLDLMARRGIQQSRPPRTGRRWVIGYFGLIRGQATVELMMRLATLLPDKIEFRFRGVITTVDKAWFDAAIAERDNVVYGGEYSNPDDLATLYEGVDLAWALDLEDIDCNSRWLLPCRFYEAGFFGVPCLAVRGFEFGQLLDRLDVGWTFDDPLEESLIHFFENLTPQSYEEKWRKLTTCPQNTFLAARGGGDLCTRIAALARRNFKGPASEIPDTAGVAGKSQNVSAESIEAD